MISGQMLSGIKVKDAAKYDLGSVYQLMVWTKPALLAWNVGLKGGRSLPVFFMKKMTGTASTNFKNSSSNDVGVWLIEIAQNL